MIQRLYSHTSDYNRLRIVPPTKTKYVTNDTRLLSVKSSEL